METVTMETKTLGRYIASDPAICHGEPTFRGTRILVANVLEQVESGMAWGAIIEEWRYTVTRDAIAEAVRNRMRGARRLCARAGFRAGNCMNVPGEFIPDNPRQLLCKLGWIRVRQICHEISR